MNFRVFLLLLTLCLSFFQSTFADPPLPTPVGRVVWVNGTLVATMENKEKRILQKTSVIYLHDTLSTDKLSQAQVVFTDNSLMTFANSTVFSIDNYKFKSSSKLKSAGKYIMTLITGGFRTITGLVAKGDPNNYEINTPVATIGVRGTDYAVSFRNGELYIAYYKGTPCVTGKDLAKTTVCLDKDHPYAKVGAKGQAPTYVTTQPDDFKEQLKIVQATLAPFEGNSGGGNSSGQITSFCIQ